MPTTARCASATNPVAPGTVSVIPPRRTQAAVPGASYRVLSLGVVCGDGLARFRTSAASAARGLYEGQTPGFTGKGPWDPRGELRQAPGLIDLFQRRSPFVLQPRRVVGVLSSCRHHDVVASLSCAPISTSPKTRRAPSFTAGSDLGREDVKVTPDAPCRMSQSRKTTWCCRIGPARRACRLDVISPAPALRVPLSPIGR
jgi:hypothetical protein